MMIRARAGLVRTRTGLVNTARGLAKSYGERLRGCHVRNMDPEKAEGLSPELHRALEPLLAGIEEVSERISEYNEKTYPSDFLRSLITSDTASNGSSQPLHRRRSEFSRSKSAGL